MRSDSEYNRSHPSANAETATYIAPTYIICSRLGRKLRECDSLPACLRLSRVYSANERSTNAVSIKGVSRETGDARYLYFFDGESRLKFNADDSLDASSSYRIFR